jgi:hypothetical protein
MECSLHNVTIRLECPSPGQEQAIAEIWSRLFHLGRRGNSTYSIPFRLDGRRPAEISGERLFDAPGLTVIRNTGGYHLTSGDSYLFVDLVRSEIAGTLSGDFFAANLENQRGLFFFAFLLALSSHGLYGIHASGLSYRGHGLLLVAGSGCGKTTLAVALAAQGWNYLSDDAVLLHNSGNTKDVEALAFGRPFSCGSDMISHFPQLASIIEETPLLSNGKRLLDVGLLYPDRFLPRCRPDMIVFPEIVDAPVSRLAPLTQTEALTRLIGQGIGLLTQRETVVGQLRLFERLLAQTRSFRLLHGFDVHSNPVRIAALLTDALDRASQLPSPSLAPRSTPRSTPGSKGDLVNVAG